MAVVSPVGARIGRVRRGPSASVLIPLGIFLASRIADAVLLIVLGEHQTAIDPRGAHVESQPGPHPGYWGLLSNWDGQWYRTIAEHGYPSDLPRDDTGGVAQNAWAFSPLFPALVRLVMVLGHLPFSVAASVVSVGSAAAAMVLLFRLIEPTGGRVTATFTVLAFCLAPAAPVLQLAYSESLCLLLVVACLTLLSRRSYVALAVIAVPLSLTRPLVLPLAAVVLLHGVLRWTRRETDPYSSAERRRFVAALAVIGLSVGIWPAVAAIVTGEPAAYLESFDAWAAAGPGRTSWLARLGVAGETGYGVFAVVMLVVLAGVVVSRRGHAWGQEPRAWAMAYGVYLAAVTPPTWSDLRHALLVIVPWWPLPFRRTEQVPRSTCVVIMAGIVLIGLPLQYWWLRSFYVVGPGAMGFP